LSQKLQPTRSARGSLLPSPNPTRVEAARAAETGVETGARLRNEHNNFYYRTGKRLIDVVVSSVGLVLLSPLLAIVGILVKGTSRGPVLFWQDRVGRGGRLFRIAKFRSMVAGAHKTGPSITSSADPRVTRLGVVLRKFKIDEFPQLWNVLKGEMSLVGPRPEMPRYVRDYTPEQQRILCVRPGITDIASIHYRHEEEVLGQSENPEDFYRRVVLTHKLDLNLQYLEQISLLSDVKLIIRTIKCLFI
jgi:lipopolysaccharide/colanic/teichoic acid biosynthesis glycosyltransferase